MITRSGQSGVAKGNALLAAGLVDQVPSKDGGVVPVPVSVQPKV